MPNRDPLNQSKARRSFCIKAKPKPHKPLHPCLRKLRIDFDGLDVNHIDLSQLPIIDKKDRSKNKPKKSSPDGESLEEIKEDLECLTLEEDDHIAIKSIRQGLPICDSDDSVELDILMPNGMTVTISCPGNKTLAALKPDAILQAKRYPLQEKLSENTMYVFYCFDHKGSRHEIFDETRTIKSLNLMIPVLGLREPEGNDIENDINQKITASVGIPLTTIESSLDDECAKFRMDLFDSIQEAEKLRGIEGTGHYAFSEETVLYRGGYYETSKPEDSTEIYERDLDEMEFSGNQEVNEERAMERLKRKIESSAGVAHIWYRPNETDDYAYMAPIGNLGGRNMLESTPLEFINEAILYLKSREGVEFSDKPEDFILQVAGKQSYITREIPLKNYEYFRSCFENYKTPVLILRLKEMIFEGLQKPAEIFVPSFVRAARNIIVEREAFEALQKEERKKERENLNKKNRGRIQLPLNSPEDLPPPEPINFWDLDEDLKVRICTASHIIITGVERLYVKVAVTVGYNVLAMRDSPIVSPSNPRWGNCLLDFGLYIKDIPKSAQLCFSLISERSKKGASELIPIGWLNMRLFDWDDFLVQGKKTIFFWPFPKEAMPKDTKDPRNLLNLTGLIGSNHDHNVARLEIELTDYGNKVRYPPFERVLQFVKILQQRKARATADHEASAIEDFEKDSENLIRLSNLRRVMDPRNLSLDDQHFLWRSRKKISSNFPSMLPIIADLPIIWKTRETFCELYGMLVEWPILHCDAAIELLDGKQSDTWIRDAAVDRIDKALDNDQLQLYLLPLVQALRYEPFANSNLSRMLVKRGLLNYKIGHTLFWLLRAELNYFDLSPNVVRVPQYYSRIAICLEMYLRGNAIHLDSIKKQVELVNILTELNAMVKLVGAKEFATKKLQSELINKKDELQNMISPLNPTEHLGELIIEKCSVLGSAKQPLKLIWKNPEPLAKLTSETHQLLFKYGDDLRQDMLTLQVMRIMDAKWKTHNLDFCMTLYEVLPMGKNIGMIHIVQNCQTLFQIQTSAGQIGSTFNMDNGLLNKYIYQKCSSDSKQYMECVDRFTYSLAGYCIATYVIGIKDRHQDNIMLAKDGRIFHIDFGHFLG
uniref:Phosphatidylinositol 3-kinase n=1 Tax=Panagrolaimus sp. PS1159 TaxID=55785 RepID=A0AC35FR39_9BILA